GTIGRDSHLDLLPDRSHVRPPVRRVRCATVNLMPSWPGSRGWLSPAKPVNPPHEESTHPPFRACRKRTVLSLSKSAACSLQRSRKCCRRGRITRSADHWLPRARSRSSSASRGSVVVLPDRRHRMRHDRLSLTALVLAGLISFPAPAQQTATQSYRGLVTNVVGEQSDAVHVGETVIVSYTVDPTDTDLYPSPKDGYYSAGLLSLSVMLPDSDFAVASGVGQIQTYDNTDNPDDQISLRSNSI